MAGLINKLNIGLGCVYPRSKQPTELTNSVRGKKVANFMKKKKMKVVVNVETKPVWLTGFRFFRQLFWHL